MARILNLPRHTCPRCAGPTARVPRQRLDRLLSLFVPVARYRCAARQCQWEGTLRLTSGDLRAARRAGRTRALRASTL